MKHTFCKDVVSKEGVNLKHICLLKTLLLNISMIVVAGAKKKKKTNTKFDHRPCMHFQQVILYYKTKDLLELISIGEQRLLIDKKK